MLTSQVWGGNYIFNDKQTPEVLEAIRNFVDYYPDDKAAIIVTLERAAVLNTWIMFLFYDGPSPPKGVFDNFTDIGPTDTTKTWDSFYDLVCPSQVSRISSLTWIAQTQRPIYPSVSDSIFFPVTLANNPQRTTLHHRHRDHASSRQRRYPPRIPRPLVLRGRIGSQRDRRHRQHRIPADALHGHQQSQGKGRSELSAATQGIPLTRSDAGPHRPPT